MSPPLTVEVLDQYGARFTGAPVTVSMSLTENVNGANLTGATGVSAINGVATFANVAVDRAAVGLVLRANAPGVTSATSALFSSIAQGPATIALSAASLSFDAAVGESRPPSQSIEITNAGEGALSALAASVTYGTGGPTGSR